MPGADPSPGDLVMNKGDRVPAFLSLQSCGRRQAANRQKSNSDVGSK